ncbi:MAG: ribbon-helix-helix protein, CopG family [Methylococcales bacterium]
MKTKEKIRMSLDLSKDLYEKLESLADNQHVSKSDILRKALGLMVVATDAKNQHKKLGVFSAEDRLEKEIVGI